MTKISARTKRIRTQQAGPVPTMAEIGAAIERGDFKVSRDPQVSKLEQRRIDYLPLGKIRPAKKNVKAHDIGAINESLGRFGYVEAVALDERTERLIAGHGRVDTLKAMKKDGQKPPPGVQVLGAYAATGENVADPFVGSGSTLIAAEQLGRRCFGMELEPRFAQLAIERWERFTGQKAKKL